MKVSLVMTVIGPDRPGLVDAISGLVTAHGGNWLESRMSRLGGQFAGILRVEVPGENQPTLVHALEALRARDLSLVIVPDQGETGGTETPQTTLEIVGQDRPGIVRQISHALAAHQVNVEDLHTECDSAPMTGETLFKARAKLHIPAACNLAALRADLERIAADLMVDLLWEPFSETTHSTLAVPPAK
jgi:glycine cleavage system regulatory protein